MVGIIKAASPRVQVLLFKTISRDSIDGQSAVSVRYQNKDSFIDLTEYLNRGSAVRTQKSVREAAGAFSITFADKPFADGSSLESIYGLVEPMDIIEIRMWSGIGPAPFRLPLIMRGFVSSLNRSQIMGDEGPQRTVTISGQDYGKIWQMFQVIYLAAYAEKQGLLTNFGLWELFGVQAQNTTTAAEFIRLMVDKIINPFIQNFIPENSPMPREIFAGDSISIQHGVVNNSYQSMQGSIYDIMKFHSDVGAWNELYTEDREDGVHCVYRAVPALKLTKSPGDKTRLIMEDALPPVVITIPDGYIKSMSVNRSDDSVSNFYWVSNPKFDLVDDMQRKLASLTQDDKSVSLKDYPNSAVKFYGVRPMYAETQQGEDTIKNMGPGLDESEQNSRNQKQEAWLEKRRRQLLEMNKDNVVYEKGTMVIKGGPVRDDGESMKAGDYVEVLQGTFSSLAYVVQISHDFMPFQSYTTSLSFERGEGFANRASAEGGIDSPWLSEQARRTDKEFPQ